MPKTEVLKARLTTEERRKLGKLAERTGLTVSGAVRALIAAADVQPVVAWRPTLTDPNKHESAVPTYQGSDGALVTNNP